MSKLNIALLVGGSSSERSVALESGAMVEQALDKDKYNVRTIDINERDWSYTDPEGKVWQVDKNDFSLTDKRGKLVFDYAFIVIHGTPGEDGRIQGYLDIMGVPYSSSDVASSAVTFDKLLCKRTVADIKGMNLAREICLRKGDIMDHEYIRDHEQLANKIGFPLFVKPNSSGSSYGVTKVKHVDDLADAILKAFTESNSVLIEEFIEGREFGCGILITRNKEYRLPVTEIVSKNEFFDYEAKYTDGMSDEITPADISEELARELQHLASEAYKVCGCKGIARVDFIVTDDGRPYMIEINSIPGMSGGSIVPKQIAAMGMSMTELMDIIIEDTLC